MKKKPSPERKLVLSGDLVVDLNEPSFQHAVETLPPVNTEEPGRPFVTRKVRETKW